MFDGILKAGKICWHDEKRKIIQHFVNPLGPVNSTKDGFLRVLSAEDGSFAFIHDAKLVESEMKNHSFKNILSLNKTFFLDSLRVL